MTTATSAAAGSPFVRKSHPPALSTVPRKKRPRCLFCEDRKARHLRVPAELNKQLFFCSASCAIQFAILEARLQGLHYCTKCKEWAGREDTLCTCHLDDNLLLDLKKAAMAEKAGAA